MFSKFLLHSHVTKICDIDSQWPVQVRGSHFCMLFFSLIPLFSVFFLVSSHFYMHYSFIFEQVWFVLHLSLLFFMFWLMLVVWFWFLWLSTFVSLFAILNFIINNCLLQCFKHLSYMFESCQGFWWPGNSCSNPSAHDSPHACGVERREWFFFVCFGLFLVFISCEWWFVVWFCVCVDW